MVSIIVPCYNASLYIDKCINSILQQTYRDIEIICINDGSTDNTLVKLQQLALLDDRILLVNQDNKGLSETRSIGLQYATKAYTMFVDSDDWLELDCLESVMELQNQYDIVCFSYVREFKNQSLQRHFGFSGEYKAEEIQRKIVGPIDGELVNVTNLDALVTVWGKLYKSENIKNVRFEDIGQIGTWEDGLFNLNILENCETVLIIDKPFYHYRKDNLESFTSAAKKDLYKKWLIKFEKISVLIVGKNSEYQIALQNRIALSVLGLALTEMNSSSSLIEKKKKISIILEELVYRNALKSFDLKYLPTHWRLFYWFAKNRMSAGIVFLTTTIQIIQKFKNI